MSIYRLSVFPRRISCQYILFEFNRLYYYLSNIYNIDMFTNDLFLEAVAQRCSVKKMFLERGSQVFSCEFCEISKNTFSYRKPLVATFLAVLAVLSLGHLRRYLLSTNLVIAQTNATPKCPLFTVAQDNQIQNFLPKLSLFFLLFFFCFLYISVLLPPILLLYCF